MITCLTTSDVSDRLLERLILKYNFDKPNTGIAFVIPLPKCQYNCQEDKDE
jgi:hypothetical protein